MNTLRQPLFREATTALLVALLLLQSATAVAPGPAWWGTQSVTDSSAIPDDFAVANIGQLKHLARKAMEAIDAELPGGAGAAIHALVDAWGDTLEAASKPDNGLAINQGQLKHVATPFYDRLGLPYPWAGSSALRDDYLLVNLGQLKHVFSFPLKFRTLGQGAVTIPQATLQAALDAWNALGDEDDKPLGSTADDLDGDGIPNLQEYLMDNPLFNPLDIDGDRIADSIEDASGGVLSKLNFADAVWDKEAGGAAAYYDLDWKVSYQGDGVMNYEEVLRLGLDPAATTTSTRTDGLTDAEVLVWTLNAGAPLALNADPLRTFWEGIDAGWMDATANSSYLGWLDAGDANNDGEPDGLAEFRADMLDPWPVWEPWNPSVWTVQAPSPVSFFDPVTLSSVLMDWDEDGMADTDRDDDGLPDLWEYRYEFNLRDGEDRNHDADNDGLTNLEEYQLGTNPRLADTDGDGFADHSESTGGGDPLVATIVPALSLSLAGSSHPYVFPGQTTPALAVKVTQGDLPAAGVTVVFDLGATAGRLLPAMHLAASPGMQMSVTTGADGVAAVTYAAGSEPGSASITATAPGITGAVEFGVTVVPVPQPFSTGGSDGGGGTYGNAAPARSTADGAEATAANIGDGFRIRVKHKDGAPAGPVPYVDQPTYYLPPSGETANPLGRVGYSDFISLHRSWQWHTQLDFEPLPSSGPFKKTAVPSGIRQYLVLVYQAADVNGAGRVPKHVGVLRFQYTDKGGRQITLMGNIPEKFVKVQSSGDSQSVKFEPPPASKSEERVHTVLLPMEFKEHESESGFDNFPRHAENPNKLERPWLMVPGDGDRPAKTDLYGAWTTKLKLEVKDGTQTITPQETGTSDPLEVTIQGGGQNDKAYVEVEKARMLDVASYTKRTLNVAVWAVTMTNDDQETNIGVGKGKPNAVCVRAKNTVLFTDPQGDDVRDSIAKTITTGPDGICQTAADPHDVQLIPQGQGQPFVTIIEPGQNGFLNTKPEGDDETSGQTLTTGADGIRQTAKPMPRIEPQNVPSAEALQAYLNKVYGNQMNVFFEVTLTPVEVAYDRLPGENDAIGVFPPTGPWYPPGMGVNNAFDFFYTGEPSGEETVVFQAAFNPAKHINVYLFGTPINDFDPATGKLDPMPLHGKARTIGDNDGAPGYKLCYVSAKGIDMDKVMWTVAHEIGHTGKLAHPRHGTHDNTLSIGFPLATYELDRKRTMNAFPFPSINSATGRMHSLFTKDDCVQFREEWGF